MSISIARPITIVSNLVALRRLPPSAVDRRKNDFLLCDTMPVDGDEIDVIRQRCISVLRVSAVDDVGRSVDKTYFDDLEPLRLMASAAETLQAPHHRHK